MNTVTLLRHEITPARGLREFIVVGNISKRGHGHSYENPRVYMRIRLECTLVKERWDVGGIEGGRDNGGIH